MLRAVRFARRKTRPRWRWTPPARAALFAAALGGCSANVSASAHTQAPAPKYVAKIVVANLQPDAQARLETYLQQRGYQNVEVGKEGGQTVLVFETDRHVAQVERDLARLDQPALAVVRRGYVVEYEAVDNIPPEIEVLFPEEDGSTVVTEQPVAITVEVPAPDTKEVTIGGKPADRVGSSQVYRAEVPLSEGKNEVEIRATDEMGNVGTATATLTLDTTAPAIAARIKIVVEGDVEPGSTVLINGETVQVDEKGHYEHEVRVRRGQKEIEIVAIDESGNKRVEKKPLGL